MSRARLLILTLLLLIPAAAHAANTCDLTITVSCPPMHAGQSVTCTSTTLNNGSASCSAEFIVGWFVELPPQQVTISDMHSSIAAADCFGSVDNPEEAENAFALCLGPGVISPGGTLTTSVKVTPSASAPANIPIVALTGALDPANFDNELAFVYAFANASLPTCTPVVSTPPVTQSGIDYTVSWTETTDPTSYVVEEATSADFANATSKTVTGTSTTFVHLVTSTTTYYYRVHASQCSGAPGPVSTTVSTVVQAPPPPTSKTFDAAVPYGSDKPVTFQIFVPAPSGKTTTLDTGYTAATDRPFLTVTPASGTIPPGGTTLTVTAVPTALPPGATTGTVTVTPSTGTPINTPVSVSLVTPVAPGGKALPPANALIIPVVTHVTSGAGPFQSDVRLTNASNSAIAYQLTYVPTATDGTSTGRVTAVTVAPGQTVALNDVAKDFFGVGAAPGDAGAGSLEIRPINNSSLLSYASSRTFVTGNNGTFGQFVAAVPFAQFAGNASLLGGTTPTGLPIISLQQVAESAKFRTNLGIVEGSGTPASGRIRVVDDLGTVLKEVPYSLKPGEHQQMNQFIKNVAGVQNLEDGRIEITVDSPGGAVSAYASVLDNKTADPLAVMPVQVSNVKATRYVVPGMAELNSPFSNFHSDLRIYNGGQTGASVTMTYFPQGSSTGVTADPILIGAGQVKAIDNVLPAAFNVSAGGGSVLITTGDISSLVATGRTYSNDPNGGTFGQFIPGVTPQQGIGTGDKPMQILQLEQSSRFRTNVGVTELSGEGADVKLTIIPPEGRTSAIITKHLGPNEFTQFNKIIASAYGDDTQIYNARIAVEVTGGSGRVAAYASVIDNQSLDPTYVPAQ